MKNILIVDVSSTVGGIETLFYGLFGKSQTYYKISFLTYSKKCAFEDEYVSLGYDVYHLRPRKEIPLTFSKQIKNFFKEHNDFDYVWVNTSSTSMYQCQYFAKRYTNAKVITHSHGTEFEKTANSISYYLNMILHRLNYKKVVDNTDLFFCCSYAAGISLFGEAYRDKLVLIRNGIRLDKYTFSNDNRISVRSNLGISNDEIVIGLFGRLSNQKNPVRAIKIFSNYNRSIEKSRLLVVGDGKLKGEVEKIIENEKLSDKVIRLGYRRDVPKLLSAIDILLMPSLFEGLPLSAIEAQASGVSCFFSDSISKEVAITDLAHFVRLEDSDEEWARYMVNNESIINREKYNALVRNEKYDINDTLQYLYSILV